MRKKSVPDSNKFVVGNPGQILQQEIELNKPMAKKQGGGTIVSIHGGENHAHRKKKKKPGGKRKDNRGRSRFLLIPNDVLIIITSAALHAIGLTH